MYSLTLAPHQNVTIDAQAVLLGGITRPGWTPSLNPDILVYDSSGRTLLNYSLNTNHAAFGALNGGSGGSFLVVVGSVDGNTNGGYQITVKPSYLWRNPLGAAPGGSLGDPTLAPTAGLLGVVPADGFAPSPSGTSHPAAGHSSGRPQSMNALSS